MPTRWELRNRIATEFGQILKATNELVGTADEMRMTMNEKGSVRTDSQTREIAAALLFAEAYGRFVGVKILCEDGMAYTSCVVLRSLLDLIIMFVWMLKDESEERARRYVGWIWKEKYDDMTKSPSRYSQDERKSIEEQYDAVKHFYVRETTDKCTGKEKVERGNRWYWPNTIQGMATDAGLTSHYEEGYRFLSRIVHIDPLYLLGRIRNLKIEYDPGFHKDILNESLVMNFTYFLAMSREINDIFSLGKTDILKTFVERQEGFKRAGDPD